MLAFICCTSAAFREDLRYVTSNKWWSFDCAMRVNILLALLCGGQAGSSLLKFKKVMVTVTSTKSAQQSWTRVSIWLAQPDHRHWNSNKLQLFWPPLSLSSGANRRMRVSFLLTSFVAGSNLTAASCANYPYFGLFCATWKPLTNGSPVTATGSFKTHPSFFTWS